MRVTVTPEQIARAFEAVKDDPSFEESRSLWEAGRPPLAMIQAICLRPEILRAFAGFGEGLYPGGLLERRVKELVIIASSQARDCQFCTAFHVDLVRLEGIVEEPLAAIADPSELTPRERLAIEYTQAAVRDSNSVPEALYDQLHEQFTDPELVELTFLIGYITMLNTFNNLLGVRYDGEYALVARVPG
jgi:AhpD family alkylhydroperoxidase